MIAASTSLGTQFTYIIPNNYIDCYFLRMHLTDVVNRTELLTKTTGFAIVEIYGSNTVYQQSSTARISL